MVAAVAERHPERFIPFAGADIMRGADAVKEVEHWVRARGFRGLSLRPFMINLPADDRHYYPFYAKCVELDVPVSIHASANWTTSRPSDLGHPRHFDQVACDFPALKLVLSHAGYPWVLEACLLAWKHPNVYLELAAHRPKYFTAPGAGWEPLLRYGQTTIQDKILYGSGAFLIGRPPAELLAEFRALPIKREVMEKWLWRNAARLLGLGRNDGTPGGRPGGRGLGGGRRPQLAGWAPMKFAPSTRPPTATPPTPSAAPSSRTSRASQPRSSSTPTTTSPCT